MVCEGGDRAELASNRAQVTCFCEHGDEPSDLLVNKPWYLIVTNI
jgi:hypothetical protein